jgi:hypothetical protein
MFYLSQELFFPPFLKLSSHGIVALLEETCSMSANKYDEFFGLKTENLLLGGRLIL